MASPSKSHAGDDLVAGSPTDFDFRHKVFEAPGGYFSYVRGTKQTYFNLMIGEVQAQLEVKTLAGEFGIEPDSEDGRLLELVQKGVQFVKEIRPGDSIPSELLDGSASWSVEERHRDAAKLKLMAIALDWLDGGGGGTVAARVAALSHDEASQKRVNDALAKLAEELELGGKEKVIERFEQLGRELSYIEALRDHYAAVQQIGRHLKMLQSIYAADRQVAEDLWRMSLLINEPVQKVKEAFQQIDAHTEDIKSAIRNFDSEVAYIRQMRDKLHVDSLLWEEMLEAWKGVSPERSSDVEDLLKSTYRFLAQNFTVARQWGR